MSNSSGSGESEGEPATTEPTELCFHGARGTSTGKVCFVIVDTATATTLDSGSNPVTKTVNVALSYQFDGDEGIKVTYARFKGNLTHDPSFGFAAEREVRGIFALFLSFIAFILSLFS
jgi:hypothetical protein